MPGVMLLGLKAARVMALTLGFFKGLTLGIEDMGCVGITDGKLLCFPGTGADEEARGEPVDPLLLAVSAEPVETLLSDERDGPVDPLLSVVRGLAVVRADDEVEGPWESLLAVPLPNGDSSLD